jgi:flagellar biosynthetic protein FliS
MHLVKAQARYQNIQNATTDPRSLLVLVYDKILQQIDLGAEALRTSGTSGAHGKPLLKAHLGVLELDQTLNWRVLPDLAESLHKLYLHILLLLGDAYTKGDQQALARASHLLSELRGTWKEAVQHEQQRAKAV